MGTRCLVFVKEEDVILTGETWTIVATLEIKEAASRIDQFHQTVQSVTETISKLDDADLRLHLDEELQRVSRMTKDLVGSYDLLSHMLPVTRQKRGLFDLGGKVVKFLFGNPDADDWARVEAALGDLDPEDQRHLVHLVHEHLTLSKEVSQTVTEQGKQLRELAGVAETETKRLWLTVNRIGVQVDTLFRQNAIAKLSIVLRTLELSLVQAHMEIGKFHEVLDLAAVGRLSSYLVPPHTLLSILGNISLSLPSGLEMVAKVDLAETYLYYDVSEVKAIATETSIRLAISIPLTTKDRIYELYRVHLFPIPMDHPKCFVFIPAESECLLISRDRNMYALVSQGEMTRCRRKRLTTCPPEFALVPRTTPSCTSARFLGTSEDDLRLCPRMITRVPVRPLWLADRSSETWVYNLPSPTQVTAECRTPQGVNITHLELRGTGRVDALGRCTVKGPTFTLLPFKNNVQTTGVRVPGVLIPSPPMVPLHYQRQINQMTEEVLGTAWENLHRTDPHLVARTDIRFDTLLKEAEMIETTRTHRIRLIAGSTTLAGSLLLLGGIAGLCIRLRRRPTSQQSGVSPAPTCSPAPPVRITRPSDSHGVE